MFKISFVHISRLQRIIVNTLTIFWSSSILLIYIFSSSWILLICLFSSWRVLTLLDHDFLVQSHVNILFRVFFSSLQAKKTVVYANGSAQRNSDLTDYLADIQKHGPNSIVALAKAIASNCWLVYAGSGSTLGSLLPSTRK